MKTLQKGKYFFSYQGKFCLVPVTKTFFQFGENFDQNFDLKFYIYEELSSLEKVRLGREQFPPMKKNQIIQGN